MSEDGETMDTMNGIDLDEIERLAGKATAGPWRVTQGGSGSNWIDAGQYDEVLAPARVECMAYCYGGSSAIELSDADAEFIAATDPPTTLALVAEVRRLRAVVQDRDEQIEGVRSLADAADEAALRPDPKGFDPIEVPWTVAVRAAPMTDRDETATRVAIQYVPPTCYHCRFVLGQEAVERIANGAWRWFHRDCLDRSDMRSR